MLSKKLFLFLHKVALFAIVFASLAPSISHALASQDSSKNFFQEICSSTGNKVVIQVITTQGRHLATEFSTNKPQAPKSLDMHLEHCPFCANQAFAADLPPKHSEIIALLELTAQKAAEYAAPVVVSRTYDSPPSQAPPSL
jgi:Protein of unknown function (DUF2946)